jgi:hypothetical protein
MIVMAVGGVKWETDGINSSMRTADVRPMNGGDAWAVVAA